jgi:hypothetical protein
MKNPKKKEGSTGSSMPNKAASRLEERRKLQNYEEEYPMQMNADGVEMMLKAVAEQERAKQAEQVGNHFAAEAVKTWTCSACTLHNRATEDACALCDKTNPNPVFGKKEEEKDDHDMWLAKQKSWMECQRTKKKPKGSKGCWFSLQEIGQQNEQLPLQPGGEHHLGGLPEAYEQCYDLFTVQLPE